MKEETFAIKKIKHLLNDLTTVQKYADVISIEHVKKVLSEIYNSFRSEEHDENMVRIWPYEYVPPEYANINKRETNPVLIAVMSKNMFLKRRSMPSIISFSGVDLETQIFILDKEIIILLYEARS